MGRFCFFGIFEISRSPTGTRRLWQIIFRAAIASGEAPAVAAAGTPFLRPDSGWEVPILFSARPSRWCILADSRPWSSFTALPRRHRRRGIALRTRDLLRLIVSGQRQNRPRTMLPNRRMLAAQR